MMRQEINWINVLKLSGAYVAYLIGSGFATGQEVLQFFASYGYKGLLGVALTTVCFMVFSVILLTKGHELQLDQPGTIFRYYCGDRVGRLVEIFTQIFLFSVVVVMISGSGAIANEYFGLSRTVGFLGMGILSMLTVVFGLRKLVDIIGVVGPIIVVLTVGICFTVFFRHLGHLPVLDQLSQVALDLQPAKHWWQGGLLFFSYNILAGMIFFTELGQQANNQREARWTAILGSGGLMLTVLAMTVAMLAYYNDVIVLEAPVLFLAETISPWMSFLSSICIMLGIYSTTAPMYWLVQSEIMRYVPESYYLVVTLILGVLFMAGGTLPFGELIGFIYPIVGYVGFAVILVVLGRAWLERHRSLEGQLNS